MTEPLLRVEDLRVTFRTGRALLSRRSRSFDAVRGVSFEVGHGETFGLVGESGSGKSSTGRALLRLVKPSGGRIVFDGQDVTAFGRKTPEWYHRAVQIVFQDPLASLNPRRTVSQSIEDALHERGLPTREHRSRMMELLDRVGLDSHHAERLPRDLSGGQRQRVAIARALAMEPRLVVCDEPVSALDVSTQSQIVNLLQDLQDDLGISYVFIGHDLSVIRHISHRIGVMYLGEMVEIGEADAVYERPEHPYTRMLLEAIPVPDPAIQRIRRVQRAGRTMVEPPSPIDPPSGCAFHTRCPFVMDVCRQGPVPVRIGDGTRYRCHLAPGESSARSAAVIGTA